MPQLLIIPFMDRIQECTSLAKEYNVGFEFNEFAFPWTLENQSNCNGLVTLYKMTPDMPAYRTSHGAFFDVLVFSDDSRIREVSELRVRQSMDVAKKLGCKGVVFHGNINPLLIKTAAGPAYQKHWLETTRTFFRSICEEYPEVNVYIENMWDQTPDNLENLGKEMTDVSNFGLCLDYAHAHISPTAPALWCEKLGPYTKHVHINDNDGISDLHLALGDGITDWAKFRNLQEKLFPNASILFETSSIDNQRKSLEFWKKLEK